MPEQKRPSFTVHKLEDTGIWRIEPVGIMTVARHALPSEKAAWSAVLYVEGYVRNDVLRDVVAHLRERVLDKLDGPWHLQVNVVTPLEVSGLSTVPR
ncbi:MAG: hypothetical protein AB2A00_18915 [Myxococcota bacterium]